MTALPVCDRKSGALELHQAGKLEQAEQLYRKVLRIQPDYFDALHMLGVAALQAGQLLATSVRSRFNLITLRPMRTWRPRWVGWDGARKHWRRASARLRHARTPQ
jgi:tetratricopeptide (TPR) repeat protein